jgi:hypothetical protein
MRSGLAWIGRRAGKHTSRKNCHRVAFRSAKGRSFAERKTTSVCRTVLSCFLPLA